MVLPAVRATFDRVFPVSTIAPLTCLAVQCSGPSASAAYGQSNAAATIAPIFFIDFLTRLRGTLFDFLGGVETGCRTAIAPLLRGLQCFSGSRGELCIPATFSRRFYRPLHQGDWVTRSPS